ncbi:hypothetical protein QR680_003940 [Steinernema hermaphroditum]|uniref:Major facilitator superfamily (MFS) profile domain-containing protein n=1 Tax=Steinernema hermaphroditum TaxID=289476 RepID=A0AA39HM44_9BILA|nr:hypothetical protein QR680_003940 [Steinernema hermaphroditum]
MAMEPQPGTRRQLVVETATLDSEISMSVATDETRTFRAEENQLRRASQPNGVPGTHHDVAMTTSAVSSSDSRSVLKRLSINVEPTIFIYSVAFGILITNGPIFIFWARCNQLYEENPNAPRWVDGSRNASAVCAHLSLKNYTEFQNDVERDISTMKIWIVIANSIPTLVTAPLIGMWSDGSGGRRKPLLISLFVLIIYVLLHLFASLTYSWLNIYYVLLGTMIFQGMLGGMPTLFSSTMAIVTDETRSSHKLESSTIPIKICVASAAQAFGLLVGDIVTSLSSRPAEDSIQDHINGYVYAYVTAALMTLIAFGYSLLCVRETHHVPYPEDSTLALSSAGSTVGCGKKAKAFVYDLVEVVVARRPGWTRFCLNLSILFVFVEFLAVDNGILFLMIKKAPFNWSDQLFSIFSIFNQMFVCFGMIAIPLIMLKFNFLGKDSVLVMVGVFASFLVFSILAFADTTQMIFVAGGITMFAGCIGPGYRSFVPRMVAKEETARVLTLFGIIMTMCPIIATPTFNLMYNATLDYWPGMTFLLAAGLNLVVLIGQLVIHCLMYPLWLRDEQLRSSVGRSGTLDDEDVLSEYVPGSEPRSISNTAVNSEMGSMEEDRRPLIS